LENTSALEKSFLNLGRKIIDLEQNTKSRFPLEDIPPSIRTQIYYTRHFSTIFESLMRTNEYKELIASLFDNPNPQDERLSNEMLIEEFMREIIHIICYGQKWNESWTNHELELITKAILKGLFEPINPTGIIIPLQGIGMDPFEINLHEYGVIRRATMTERVRFAIEFPNQNHIAKRSRFRFVLDVGHVDTESLFPVPSRYLRILERVIFSLRILYGGYVGVDYIHYWSANPKSQNEIATLTIPISNYLQSRFVGIKQDETTLFPLDEEKMYEIIKEIHALDEDSFYIQAFRRYGASVYTLDFGFGDAVVDSVVALECLFGDNKPKAIQRILEITRPRKRDILWEFDSGGFGEVSGLNFEKLLRRCWTARNKIAHGKSSSIAKEEAKMDPFHLSRIAQLFLRYSLLRASELGFPNREKLHDNLDNKEE